MKNILVLTFALVAFISNTSAQNGSNCVRLTKSGASHQKIRIDHNANGSLDNGTSHTIEMWVRFSRIDLTLYNVFLEKDLDGYTLALNQGKLLYLVYDADGYIGVQDINFLQPNTWYHIAVSYNKTGEQRLYVNGKLAASKSASGKNVNTNTDDIFIGNSRPESDAIVEVDEFRFWNTELTSATIKEWMYRTAGVANHPNNDKLAIYLQCNESVGSNLVDASGNGNISENYGTFVSSSIPFKGQPQFVSSSGESAGVWNGQDFDDIYRSSILMENAMPDQAAVLETIGTKQPEFCTPDNMFNGVDKTTCRLWHSVNIGNPKLRFLLDLSDFDLSGIVKEDIVLLISTDAQDFTSAKVVAGSIPPAIDEFTSDIFVADSKDMYYYLGFVEQTANSKDIVSPLSQFSMYPNPSNGQINIDLNFIQNEISSVSILDITGKELVIETFDNGTTQLSKSFDLSGYPTGIYMVRVASENGFSTKRFIVQ